MWKVVSAGVGMVVGSIAGVVLGDRWAREEFAERWSVVNQIVEQNEGNAERQIAAGFLGVAKLLRDDDTDKALEIIEATIERQRALIAADQGTPRASGLDSNILKSIEEYQSVYPWSPPAPSPEESEFAALFGALAPRIENGRVIGFSVRGVQPGSVFAQIGVADGDIITHWGGRPVSTDRRPSLFEVLQSGSRVDLVLREPDGTVRQVVVPQR